VCPRIRAPLLAGPCANPPGVILRAACIESQVRWLRISVDGIALGERPPAGQAPHHRRGDGVVFRTFPTADTIGSIVLTDAHVRSAELEN
jgi:hypothetical protein